MIRKLVSAATCVALLCTATASYPQVAPDYRPTDKDERGLWLAVEQEEAKLKTSDFVVRDAALNAYVRDVLCREVGADACKNVRIYLIRTPYFNASMAPNGMMQVWTGLLLRMQNEAELAAVLGHEYGHYSRRHTVELWREARGKSGAAAWLSLFGLAGSIVALGMISSVFAFSRDMESEADALSVGYLRHGGYDARQAARIWESLRAEMDATAVERNQKSRKDKNGGLFATHPPSAERVAALGKLANDGAAGGGANVGRDSYRAAIGPLWQSLIDDQIKLNDFGGTEFLLKQLADDGWNGQLLFARAELYRVRGRPDDLAAAADFYRQAIAQPDAPAEAWRGLGLALLRAGKAEEARPVLTDYLQKKPEASDRTMIAAMAGITS